MISKTAGASGSCRAVVIACMPEGYRNRTEKKEKSLSYRRGRKANMKQQEKPTLLLALLDVLR